MAKRLTDRDMLIRTLFAIGNSNCCDFFACPGPDARPVPMASCAQATAAYELRDYLRRNGGWCPEHGQELSKCHGWNGNNARHEIGRDGVTCHCAPCIRKPRTNGGNHR